jgi:outer membrane receptor protein involved in Fe transport
MTLALRLAVVAWLLATLAIAAEDKPTPAFDFAGRPLAEALEELRAHGLRLVYGSNTVQPEMLVETSPSAAGPREVLDQILAPHGLAVRESEGGLLSIVLAEDGAIFGGVYDVESGDPLADAEVQLIDGAVTRTDPNGQFALDPVAPGERVVEARRIGYVIERLDVKVQPGERVETLFQLNPVSKTLEEMTVIPSSIRILDDQPTPGVLWTREEVNRLPHLSDDVFRAIQRLPGITTGDFSADFHVRGGERSEVLVLIDGLQVYDPYHLKDFQNVFSIFDSNATEAVEVMSGGFTAEYGDRMSGVVEITSAVPLGRQTMVGVSFEKFHFLSQGRLPSSGGEWLVNARRGYLDLILDPVQTDENDFDLDPVYYDLFAKVRRPVGASGLLSASLLAAADDAEFLSADDDDELTSSYSNAYGWLRLENVLGRRASVSSLLSYGRLDSEREGESGANVSDPFFTPASDITDALDRTRVRDIRSTDVAQFRQDWLFDLSDRQHLRGGLEARWLRADYDYTSVNTITDPLFTDDDSVTERRFDLQPDGWTYGAYFADRFRLGKRVTLEAGARWDRQTYSDDEQWGPRLNLVAQLSSQTTLRASAGHYWQPQGIHELQVEDGVDEFHPAQLNRQLTVGLDHLFDKSRLSVQLYSKRLEDPRPRFENLFEIFDIFPEGQSDRVLIEPESGRARGLELLFERRQRRLDWWITYALSEAEDKIDGEYVPRSWDQRHAVSYSVNIAIKEHWNLNVAGIHHSGWPATDAELVLLPTEPFVRLVPGERNATNYRDYHRVDVRASRAFETARGQLKLFLEITNLFDRDNTRSIADFEVDFSPGTGFTINRELESWFPRIPSFGVTWTF